MTLEKLHARLSALLTGGMDPLTPVCIMEDNDPTAVLAVVPQSGFHFREESELGLRNANGRYLQLQALHSPKDLRLVTDEPTIHQAAAS